MTGPPTKPGAPASPLRALLDRLRSGTGRRIAAGTAWTAAGNVAGRGLTLLGSIVVARQLGRDGFGAFGIVQSTAIMVQNVAALGINWTASKHVAEFRSAAPERAGRVAALSSALALAAGVVGAAALALGAPILAEDALGHEVLVSALQAGALAVVFGALSSAQMGALSGLEEFRALAVANAAAGAGAVLFTAAGAAVGGVTGCVWGYVLSAAVTCAVLQVSLRRALRRQGIRPGLAGAFREWRIALSSGLPAFLMMSVGALPNWASNALLVRQPGGLLEMGAFGAAYQWRTAVFFIPTVLNTVMLPVLCNLLAQGAVKRYRRLLALDLGVNVLVTAAGAAAVSLAGGLVMAGYGASFAGAGPRIALVVLVLSTVPGAAALVAIQVLTSTGKMWWAFLGHAWIGGFLLVATWLQLFGPGALGLAWAHLWGCVGQAVLVLALAWRSRPAAGAAALGGGPHPEPAAAGE